ncbi:MULTISPECIES: DUF805 domain-containing protein [Rhizobium]|uniref:DUF805 domain-containing protein n=1 Tax=Rhizobium tropici TaxID=398 RepID=A0A6P1C831_RHITR|nr:MULTISPECIES: DUF805 domain-containing protein [Rhizobium]AGB74199.1 putative inner membrane protein [Rhizobium tropici CIAT 899]MBB4240684.1 uncharacterized membrane protein YhaH (DUF805 family) [Rhizobium tropici]MBB5591899.1 uncharacterized membrane protein YhaH (DUF805 family) [Rhizobium tropici]MBB6490953.1 uncharacterized membrane protein YhaH (DUF805 family) [Rhizobium tropici]NEV12611.1 DUF805 domain-containing protein [Rhizobium tropici]
MGFTEAVRTVLKQKYATFSGRAARSEFWWFQLFVTLLFLVYGLIGGFLAGFLSNNQNGPSALTILVIGIGGIIGLALLLPMISLQVRRFHDRNISGWWYLGLAVLGLIPYVGFLTGIAFFVINVLPGTVGPNKFGADPLRPEARAAVFA